MLSCKRENKMAIHIKTSSTNKNNDKNHARLHLMPCVIKSNGEANVSSYFEPIITPHCNGVLKASFRGYPLLGKELHVPKNYQGIILQETRDSLSDETERTLYKTHTFDKFTYWNWDIEPSDNDKIVMAMDWLEIAQVLHSPIDT